MESAIKLSIDTYSKLTGRSFEDILNDCLNGNEVIIEIIQKLMIASSSK